MNDIFRLVFAPVDTAPDVKAFYSGGTSVHGSLVEAVKEAVRGREGTLVPFIFSRGVVFRPRDIEAFSAELHENLT